MWPLEAKLEIGMGMDMEAEGVSAFTNINYLDPKEAIFATTDGGLLSLQVGDRYYSKVDLYQAFPFSLEHQYLSVRDENGEEIGMIKDLREFPPQSQKAIRTELNWRYYAPKIIRVLTLKDEFGHLYWDVETNYGFRKFVTRARDEGIYPIADGRLLIVDMTGNRYEIEDYRRLDAKSLRFLEPYI